ncbi:MAG: hypothetical protein D6711_10490 [Chloroflexi bacterium]|nr:MAG: hypothetical protein D6711_10490 [Chloroflexota bacterium]
MNNVQQALEIRLSNDELTFLLRVLGVGGIPGFSAAGQFSDDEAEAAFQSLIARGYVEPGEDAPVVVDERVAALVGSGALANRNYSVVYFEAGQQITQWFYLLENFPVHHMEVLPGVHRFRLLNDAEDVVGAIGAAMNLDTDLQSPPPGEKVQMSLEAYEYLGKLNREKGPDAAAKFMAQEGLPQETIHAILNHEARVICTMVQTHDDMASATGFLALKTEAGYWLIEPEAQQMIIYPASVKDVMNRAIDLLETAVE